MFPVIIINALYLIYSMLGNLFCSYLALFYMAKGGH